MLRKKIHVRSFKINITNIILIVINSIYTKFKKLMSIKASVNNRIFISLK